MNKISALILSVFLLQPLAIAQVNVTQDVLPNTNSSDSTAVLNNNLRLNQNAINALGGYFNSNGALGIANGGTGAVTAQAAINNLLGPSVQGDIVYFNGSNWVHLPAGTSGYFLQTAGSSANPLWAAAPSPPIGFNLVSTTSITGASTTGSITISPNKIYFVQYKFINFTGSATLLLRFNGDSTSGNYKYVNVGASTSGAITNSSASATSIQLCRNVSGDPAQGINGDFFIEQLGSSQIYRVWGQGFFDDATSSLFAMMTGGGTWTNAADVSSFAIQASANNMTGTVYLYELKTS